ncbi:MULTISPECIES: YjzD family protein [Virgibacillus]|uniref:YjzD family protein n=1 Tax=Virgibacillus TaxID=84406 RepID=UPI00090C9734|nr:MULTISPECIES: YjzD family protein [Virgibacillus]API91027.1 DUF2929 domain-containing protein [Virgibacillus sp. 6R]MBS7429014.1 YjzD family protein [Virgibacillus sp. 19R1-5]MBU8566767.1 YjzD family protein [Virgibacillus pantothenticus]MBU8600350.1 YjzD family protein [Virgibacillus pantothenticus]MBU8634923.1 YjzD family protein [Virgibacillus pantothenticus]
MRYIVTLIWACLIGAAVSYVLSSMGSEPFNLTATIGLAVVFFITISVLGDGILKEDN